MERTDVVIVGGGAAGRSAALVLGRARRSVVVVDDGQPSNRPSTGVGGLLGHDGVDPGELYRRSDDELARYPSVARRRGRVTDLRRDDRGSWVAAVDAAADPSGEPAGEASVSAGHVVLAMGMAYDHPRLAGIEPLWGASVFHCPFCHGWEHRDRPLAVLGGGPGTVERALLLTGWTDTLTLVVAPRTLDESQRAALARGGVDVVEGAAARLVGTGRQLQAVELTDGRRVAAEGLLVTAAHRQRSDLVERAGVALEGTGHVVVDELGRTDQPGIWAVGDLTSPVSSVARAVATGSLAATWLVHDLTAAAHGLPFPPPGAPGGPPYGPVTSRA